jgi:hypothetical protein
MSKIPLSRSFQVELKNNSPADTVRQAPFIGTKSMKYKETNNLPFGKWEGGL